MSKMKKAIKGLKADKVTTGPMITNKNINILFGSGSESNHL